METEIFMLGQDNTYPGHTCTEIGKRNCHGEEDRRNFSTLNQIFS